MARIAKPKKLSPRYPLTKVLDAHIRSHPDLADNSKILYNNAIRYFRLGLGCEPKVCHLNDRSIRKALNKLREIGRKPSTLRFLFKVLKFLWRPLWEDHRVDEEIRQRPPKIPKTPSIAWFPDDLAKLFAAIDATPGRVGPVLARHWWRALCEVFLDTGERRHAVMSVRWCDLDEVNHSITFQHHTRKGGMACNTVRLHDNTWASLMRIKPKEHSPNRKIFWTTVTHSNLHVRFGAIIKRAKLPDDAQHKFHCLRKTAATQIAIHTTSDDRVGAASDLLGHSNKLLTLETYLDKRQLLTVIEQPCDVVPRVAPYFDPKPKPKNVIPQWMLDEAKAKLAKERQGGLPSS